MDVKLNTQNWSKSPQVPSLKDEKIETISASDKKESLKGHENIGEYLNKVADPNWIDPEKNRKIGNPNLDKDSFFKLMLTQLKNQDPLNPQQSHEMAAQLAQFTSLEKLSNINQSIENLLKQKDPEMRFQALEFIGKSVSGDSSRISHNTGETHNIRFDILGDAKNVDIDIQNENGQSIRKYTLNNLKKGSQHIEWNGRDQSDLPAAKGDYRLTIEAKTENNLKIGVKTEFNGIIEGVDYATNGPLLVVEGQKIPVSEIKQIRMPNKIQAEKPEKVDGASSLSTKSLNIQDNKENKETKDSSNKEQIAEPGIRMQQVARDKYQRQKNIN